MQLQITNIEGVSFATSSNAYQVYGDKKDSDIFEAVIDGLILDRYADEDTKEYIKSLSKDEKRVASLLQIGQKSDNKLWSDINDLLKERKKGYQRLKDVYFLLRDYVKIADVERKKHGEILTPFKELAQPMINLVEKYDTEFWKNPNHKVLDSSAGYGTFLILAAYKFMVGLKDWEPDEEKRFKWVVENCLYYGELQAKSVFSWLVAIDPYDEYKTNTYWGSFLTDDFDKHAKDIWGVEKFDLIIQNPPYQMRKEGFKKTQPLWHLFVQKSMTILKEGRYMVMVHPSGWRNVDGVFKETQNTLKSKHILELHINNERRGLEIFGAETRFDYYIVKNSISAESKIICQNGKEEYINLSKMEFIPNGMFGLYSSLLPNDNDEKVKIISNSSYHTQRSYLSKIKNDIYRYPCVYTVKSGDTCTFWYSSINKNGHFNIPKLIWSNFRISSAGSISDKFGEFGLTQFSYAIVDDPENLDNIKLAFDSKLFRNFMELCSVGDMSINRKVISLFKKDFWKTFINREYYVPFKINRFNDISIINGLGSIYRLGKIIKNVIISDNIEDYAGKITAVGNVFDVSYDMIYNDIEKITLVNKFKEIKNEGFDIILVGYFISNSLTFETKNLPDGIITNYIIIDENNILFKRNFNNKINLKDYTSIEQLIGLIRDNNIDEILK